MNRRRLVICLILFAGILAIYWPVFHFGFVDFDDNDYITANPQMATGLSRANLVWAFTTFYAANYHPLTWISLLLDRSMFGLRPQPMHIENVLWHAANTLLLFFALAKSTRNIWPSAFVAAIFAVHPTHVESVAWITERKDMLSTFFSLLALLCYLNYVSCKSKLSYTCMLVFYACGLLSKSMLVTFPFLLLLLDYWPLRRLRVGVIAEKIPLLLLAALSSVLTYKAQQSAMAPVSKLPISLRFGNATLSYVDYLRKNFWPTDLAVLYPYRPHVAVGAFVIALGLLIAVSLLAFRASRSLPYLIVGWLWFLGTLVPVIGIVQVGQQSMADRYLYIPSVGISIMLVWTARDLVRFTGPWVMAVATSGIVIALGITARHQVWYWQDTDTLLGHASRIVNGNAIAEVRLGYAAAHRGNFSDARQHYQLALKADPMNYSAEFDLGNLFLKDQPQIAVEHFQRATQLNPTAAEAQTNWGIALLQLNLPAAAFDHFHSAETLDPDAYDPHYNLGQLLRIANRFAAAHAEFELALRARPDDPNAFEGWRATDSQNKR